jgi:hypothetical protein
MADTADMAGTPAPAGVPAPDSAGERAAWRAVGVPAEHGGWGLTLEPVLLGLVVAWSWPGAALGLATFVAFLARTPLKLVLVDRRRNRRLPRTRTAARIVAGEAALLGVLTSVAVAGSGWAWAVPALIAVPLVATELWFDVRSRSRRLVPELCGAVGIAAAAAAIVVAGDGGTGLAAAAWIVLAARAVASIPYVRTQVLRLRHPETPRSTSDASQAAGAGIAAVATLVHRPVLGGAVAVAVLAALQWRGVRRPVPPVTVLGVRQMLAGLAVVAATAIGVLASA